MIPFHLHRRIPFIRRPFFQRDQARLERDRIREECDRLRARLETKSNASANLPKRVETIKAAYDPSRGGYRREDGSLDIAHTEIETLETWNGLLKCIRPKTVVETGVYYGLSTCYIAAALRDSGVEGAKVYSIDPWRLEHYWEESDLEPFVEYIPLPTQEAAPQLSHLSIDVLFIDSVHTYAQSSWELVTFEPQIREGGYIIMHDTLLFDGVGRTAKHLYEDSRFEVITIETPRTMSVPTISSAVPMGCTIARKIRHGAPILRDDAWLAVPESLPKGPQLLLRKNAAEMSPAPAPTLAVDHL
jgi:predicted O-methyltransferase YrrM